jgi:hypothetical protein
MVRDVEHFFMCFFAIWISFLEKVLFSSVAHFFIGSLILGQEGFSFLSSLYILVISPLSDPPIALLRIYPKECDLGYSISTCTPMCIATLFTIAKLWKKTRCPTTDEWIKKMWYLYTMEFYSVMKKNEILSFANKWMELKNIILSEVSQAQKAKNCMFSLICGL